MSLPKELTELKQWVCWRLVPDKDGGKDKKIPFNPDTGKPASSNKPDTWTDYATAVDALERYGFTGLGFVFSDTDGLVGVDIDHCFDKETGSFNEIAMAVLAKQPTYVEFSPSGNGVHLFFKGTMPTGGSKNTSTGVEMYDKVRYFTATGNKLSGSPDIISENNGALQWIHETYIQPPKKTKKKTSNNKKAQYVPMSDEALLEKAQSSGDADAFIALWEGNWKDSYSSQSEADLSLCCKLAFWSGKDKEQMDRLFRQSVLFRDKWDKKHHADGATYGEETLNKAVEATDAVYSPGNDAAVFEHDGRGAHLHDGGGPLSHPKRGFALRRLSPRRRPHVRRHGLHGHQRREQKLRNRHRTCRAVFDHGVVAFFRTRDFAAALAFHTALLNRSAGGNLGRVDAAFLNHRGHTDVMAAVF